MAEYNPSMSWTEYLSYIDSPNIRSVVERYGVVGKTLQPYAIIGTIEVNDGYVSGILGFTSNEFYAHILKRELSKYGYVSLERTEAHSSPTFNIESFQPIGEKNG